MEKLAVILIFVFAFGAHASYYPVIKDHWLFIDCGLTGDTTELYYNMTWFPDNFFVDSGRTKQINPKTKVPDFMSSLRYFPEENDNNCFRLQLDNSTKYLFRAGFYYGNYDEKSKPPIFDLLLGGQLWATVDTSVSDQPIFHELIFQTKNDNISVCLVGKNGGTPFISSLEATSVNGYSDSNAYKLLTNGTALYLINRTNFGSRDRIIEPWSGYINTCEENLNRYWYPMPMPGYINYTFEANGCTGMYYENRPPNSMINTAISPPNGSNDPSISFSVKFPNPTPQSAYFVFYFHHEINESRNSNGTRKIEIYIDGVLKKEVVMEKPSAVEIVTLYPILVGGTANVTISQAKGSTFPPLLNGLEVFTSKELLDQPALSNGFKLYNCTILLWCFHAISFIYLFNYWVS